MEYEQTDSDLKTHLKEQIAFMILSCRSFDQGFSAEAKRMALTVRVLLHDTKSSKSLLTQMNRKSMLFYDTAYDYDPRNLMATMGLIMMRMGADGPGYVAPLDDGPPSRYKKGKVPFDQWWNKVVFVDTKHNVLTRKDLVLAVCNKDGGAHIDRRLDKAYADLARFGSLGWIFEVDGVQVEPATPPELTGVRQIAHEVLKSLKDGFPELL